MRHIMQLHQRTFHRRLALAVDTRMPCVHRRLTAAPVTASGSFTQASGVPDTQRAAAASPQEGQQQQQQQQSPPLQQQQHSSPHTQAAQQTAHQQPQPQQQQPQPPAVPSIPELLSAHGARLTTAAQMVWLQVLRPGDTAVDATCGNGHDSLFMAQCIGPSGRLHAVDLQAAAVTATKRLLESSLPPGALPSLHVTQACHSTLQQLVGSNVASLVAFNLGYLPGGDKAVITQPGSTLAAVEAALEVVRPGGLVSIMAYVGHEGGLREYEAVAALLAGLPPTYWTSSELRLLNRPSAPVLLLLWRQ